MGGAYLTRGGASRQKAMDRLYKEIERAGRLNLTDVRDQRVDLLPKLVESGELSAQGASELVASLQHDWPTEEGRDLAIAWLASAHVHS